MELQAQLTALEEEVGMLKGEIKAILQEVRVAVLARQNPFLADDADRLVSVAPVLPAIETSPGPVPSSAETASEKPARSLQLATAEFAGFDGAEDSLPARMSPRRPVDLAALMIWVQESAETFSHTEFVMLVTMASYADYFDAGLKQALLDMSEQLVRDGTDKASLADFSLALKKLEAIRATSGRRSNAA